MTIRVLFLLILASWVCFFTEFQSACAAEMQVLHGHVPKVSKGLTAAGRLPGNQQLNLAIALPLRNKEALTNLLRDIYDPASPNFRHYLTPEQFTAQFGPTESDFQAVADFAKASGFTVTELHRNRLLVDVRAAVADVEKAFHVKMRTYAHPSEKRTFYAPDAEPSLALSVPLAHISGLDNATPPKPRYHLTSPNAAPSSGSGVSGTYAGSDFRAAYVPDTILTGAGQTVGLLQFDGYAATDITSYENAHGLPNVTLTNVLLDGFSGAPSGNGGEVEVSLDIEMSLSMAPGLSQIMVYEAGPFGNWHDMLNRMANDNLARQLSCSWYIPGGPSDPVADGIFQQMALQGQTFFAACGDFDAYSGLIPFPDDTPYITQVGGTMLATSGPGGARTSESVWNRNNGIGTGGGISTQYPIPSYQTNISMAHNQGSTTMRNIPDIALTAESVDVRADGSDFGVGGTSCAAPLWAGFAALVNQQAAASGHSSVGFINPALDAIGTGSISNLCFDDITNGNNTSSGSPMKFIATNGFDLCTGWGTPAGQKLINALANPEPLLITPFQGFAAFGGAGGPFTVSSESLTLTNTGTNAFNWIVTNSAAWLTVTPASGSLTSGGPATVVTVSLNAAASNLMAGTYTTMLSFTNLNDNIGQSLPYSLNIILPPMITNQPADQPVLDGQTAVFSAGVTGGLPLTYQWQFNGTNLSDGGNISGSGTNTLTISSASSNNAGTYVLVVTNAAGMAISSNATLSLVPSAPVITQQPTNETIYVTFGAQFSVAAVGTKPFSYQWALNGTNLNGATNATLTLTNVQPSQAGNYAVIVSNSINSTLSSNAVLTVNPLPPCDPPPAGLVSWWQAESNALDSASLNNGTLAGGVTYGPGEVGQAFMFPGTGSGVQLGDPTNLWLQDFTIEMWMQRASSSIISQNNPSEAELFCWGPNGYGFGIHNDGSIFLTQVGIGSVTVQASLTNTSWHHLAASKSGSTVVFYVDGVAFPVGPYNPGFSFTSTLTIGAAEANLVSSFYGSIDELAVYNRGLSAPEIQLIYLVGPGGKCPLPPVVLTQPANQSTFVGGAVTVAATITGSPSISYQWTFNGTNVIPGATNVSLTLSNLQLNQSGAYAVLASNSVGSALSSNALVTVTPVPPCDPAPSGLVSWWQAEGNALDSSGGNNGVPVGGAAYGAGEVGQSFTFPGNGSGVQLGNPTNLQLQNFTIEMWLKRGSSSIISSNNPSEAELFCWGPNGYGFGINNNGSIFLTQVGVSVVTAPTSVSDISWHHVAVTTTNGNVIFYVDGVAYPVGAYNPSFIFTSTLTIGAAEANLVSSFYGSIDELAVYNRALTASEIQGIYQVGPGGKCPLPLSFTSEPVSQTVFAGNTVTFTAGASGSPPFTYEWIFNGTNVIATNTSGSLTLNNVQLNQAGNYSVLVSNLANSVLSSNALLTVNPLPPCDPAPSGLVSWWNAEGTALDAAGGNAGVLAGGVTYGPGEVGQAFVFPGSGSGVQLGSPTNLQLQSFTIEMWLKRASTTIVSSNNPSEAELFSWGPNGYGFGIDTNGYLFLTQVGNISVTAGTSVNDLNWHHVAVTKNGNIVVIYVDGVAYPVGVLSVTFSFSSTLTIGAAEANLVSAFYGSIDEVAVYNRALTVSEIQGIYQAASGGKCPLPVTIANQPASQIAFVGTTATFAAGVSGSPPFTYEWIFNGTEVIPGATNLSLSLTNVQLDQSGTYELVVENNVGQTNTSNAVLTVDPVPSCDPLPSGIVSWWKAEGNATDPTGSNNGVLAGGVTYGSGEVGQAFVFSGNASGVQLGNPANLQLQNFTIEMWLKRGSSSIISSNNPSEAELLCWGSNGYGFGINNNGTIFLTQVGSSAVTASTTVTDTSWHHLAVTKNGSTVVFYVDGVAYPVGAYNVTFSFSSTLTIGSAEANLVSAFCGSIDELTVYNRGLTALEIQSIYSTGPGGKCVPVPVVLTQPASQLAMLNCSATFNVSAIGGPLGYQWWKDGIVMPGQTGSNLVINSIQSSNFGGYFVVITNVYGSSVVSSNALLALDHAPVPGSDTLGRFASGGLKIPTSALLTNDTDADRDELTVIAVSSNSFANGTVSLQGGWIYYTPPANNTNFDIYTYTVSDGHCGGTATGFVTVQIQPDGTPSGKYGIQAQANGSVLLNFYGGFPGTNYRVQYSPSLINPVWQDISTNTADFFGGFQFTDTSSTNAPMRYYRSITP